MKYDALPRFIRHPWLAAVLLTRLPLPRLPDQAFRESAAAVWSYPIVGVGLAAGGTASAVGLIQLGVPALLAGILLLAITAISTGAMHEDGLADVADGFWGGHDRENRLRIMKDSQIGTFGVLALILTCGLRAGAYGLLLVQAPLFVLACAALSRAAMPLLMCALPHARRDGLSHSVGRPARGTAALGFALASVLALACAGVAAVFAIALVFGAALGVLWLARVKIGGQTGDVLGATQIVTETAALLWFVTLLG